MNSNTDKDVSTARTVPGKKLTETTGVRGLSTVVKPTLSVPWQGNFRQVIYASSTVSNGSFYSDPTGALMNTTLGSTQINDDGITILFDVQRLGRVETYSQD